MNGNGDELRKTAIIVLGAVLITSIISLTVTIAISGRTSDNAIQWITVGTIAVALVAAGPIVVLRPQRDKYRDSKGHDGTVIDRDADDD